ncbi:MAG TPA: TonB family protein [Verrucomicrobiae bacterium]|jgi:TonB family protein
MNRLQKKCIIVTAGLHLLLLAVLVFGPGFFNREPKVDNSPVLDMIPANVIDAALNSGVKSATPPPPQAQPQPPQPQIQPQTQVQPQQTQPVPNLKLVQPTPAPTPKPTIESEIKKWFTPTPKPEPEKPTQDTEQNQPHKIVVDTHLVTGQPLNPRPTTRPNHSQDNARAINSALTSLKSNLSQSTKIDLSGNSSVAYANYGSVVTSVYNNAWVPPHGMSSDNVTVKFKVRISSDGSVISSAISVSSGDPDVDQAVQRMLDRVTFIAPFPDGATDKERNYTINFNATRISE